MSHPRPSSSTSSTPARVKVVDLTQPLGPDTPVIGLPPMFGAVARA